MRNSQSIIKKRTLIILSFASLSFIVISLTIGSLYSKNTTAKIKNGVKVTQKLKPYTTTKIENMSGETPKPNQAFTLKGTINSHGLKREMVVQWILPKELTVVSGKLKTILNNLRPGQPQYVEITLKSSKKSDLQKVLLQAYDSTDKNNYRSISQHNVFNQKSLDQKNKALKYRNDQYMKKHGYKIFQ